MSDNIYNELYFLFNHPLTITVFLLHFDSCDNEAKDEVGRFLRDGITLLNYYSCLIININIDLTIKKVL